MDLGAGLADFAVHALWLQAGAMIALAVALAAAVARARRSSGSARGADRRRERRAARRALAAQGSGERARPGGGGERGQIALSDHDEPRNPHPDQRHSRHGRPVAGGFARSGKRKLRRGDPQLGKRADRADRRNPRSGQDRGGAFRSGRRDGRSASAHRGRGRTARAARPEQGHRDRLPRSAPPRRASFAPTACACARSSPTSPATRSNSPIAAASA